MSKTLPTVVLEGNLTRDPELKVTPSGRTVCNFSVACNKGVKDSSGQWTNEPHYYDCTVWDSEKVTMATNFASSAVKGTAVVLEGTIEISTWEQNGETRRKPVINVDKLGLSIKWRGYDSGPGYRPSSQVSTSSDETYESPGTYSDDVF
jgi:single-strand DNA-binding protein